MAISTKQKPEHNTVGRRAFIRAMEVAGLSQAEVARQLGVGQPSVCAWVYGHSRPESARREQLEILFAIPRHAWDTPGERAAVERVRRACAKRAA